MIVMKIMMMMTMRITMLRVRIMKMASTGASVARESVHAE